MSKEKFGLMGPRGEAAELVMARLFNEHRHPGRRKEDRVAHEQQKDRRPDRLVGGINVVAETVNIYMGEDVGRSMLPDNERLKAVLPALLRALREIDDEQDKG